MYQTIAPAKVNLSLSVGSPQPAQNMLHPLVSMMTTVDFCDELSITRLDEGDLSRYAVLWHEEAPRKSQINWSITSDLAVRAHRHLEAEVDHPLPVQMKLEKRIPVGAGLGGGSSDAAAMLRATASLFDLNVNLHTIAAALGSDVPFLVEGGTKLVSGLGEVIESAAAVDTPLVLILPPYGCPTGEVYDAFDELTSADVDPERVCRGDIFNDLTDAAMKVSETLSSDMEQVASITENDVHLSGSGSSMFVICDTAMRAEDLATTIEEKTGLVAIATHTTTPTMELEKTE